MNKKILLVSIFVVFMLVIPVKSAVQYQNKQNMTSNVVEPQIYGNVLDTSNPCPICIFEETIQREYPEYYNLFLERKVLFEEKIQMKNSNDVDRECEACLILAYLIFSPFTLFWLLFVGPFILMDPDYIFLLPCARVCNWV